jgi:Acetokinase family
MTNINPLVLAVNSGSSSIKYALFTLDADPRNICQGSVGSASAAAAVNHILDEIGPHLVTGMLAGVVHRVVHGGERFDRPQGVTTETLHGLRVLIPLAPTTYPTRSRSSRPSAALDLRYRRSSASIRRSIAISPRSAARCPSRRRRAFVATAFMGCPTPTSLASSNGSLAQRPPRAAW